MTRSPVPLDGLPDLPRDQAGPVFNEPWEAQAFALAVRLSEAGYFSWSEWSALLGTEIKAAQAKGDPDLGKTYYRHWLNALERMCITKGLVQRVDMRQRKGEWRQAYLNTPHGQAVELQAAFPGRESRSNSSPGVIRAEGRLRDRSAPRAVTERSRRAPRPVSKSTRPPHK
jgi:nitrile hydratase accessory protein